jgi:predicted nucleic acid-binding protein
VLGRDQAVIPSIWPLEIANALLVAERWGRVTRSDTTQLAAVLGSYPIEVDPVPTRLALTSVLDVARDYQLSSYDAAYLELSMRRALPIATLDEVL